MYLKEESMDKKKQPFDTAGWKLENVKVKIHNIKMYSYIFV